MYLELTAPPDRSEAIKDLIERWIEKNKAKEQVAPADADADKTEDHGKAEHPDS
ncbi:MAG TPA: hypothetical protein VK645_17170 [Chitinophagaceae bacterium]|nr:hypothetical protein [Chitinophagaceae bacterium]